MAKPGAKQTLLKVMRDYAFDPILNAKETTYTSDAQKRLLKEIKQTTEQIQKFYYREPTAEDVYKSYKRDLDTNDARRYNQKLDELHLPTLEDIEYRVDQTAKSLELETE